MKLFRSRYAFEFLGVWVEIFLLAFFAFGILIGLFVQGRDIAYVVLFLFGIITGSLLYKNRRDFFTRTFILAAAFGLGFIIGCRNGNLTLMVAVFLASNILSYQVLRRGLVKNI